VCGIRFLLFLNGCVNGSLVCVIRSLECVNKFSLLHLECH